MPIEVCLAHLKSAMVAEGGGLLGIHRAPLDLERLVPMARAFERLGGAHPAGLVSVAVFRLDPRFPLLPGFDSNIGELADCLRAADRHVRCFALVLELGEMRQLAFRAATRAVWALARPRAELGIFSTLSDAREWIAPRAEAVGALDDPGAWVKLYRRCDAVLTELDGQARNPPVSSPPLA